MTRATDDDSLVTIHHLLERCSSLGVQDPALYASAEQARKIAQQINHQPSLIQCHIILARYHLHNGAESRAIALLEPLLEMPFQLNRDTRASCLILLSAACSNLDETRKTVRYASEALGYLDETLAIEHHVAVYGYLAKGLLRFGAYHDALEHYKKQLSLLEEHEISSVEPYIGIAWVNQELGNFSLCRTYLEEGLRLSRARHDDFDSAQVMLSLATLHHKLEEYNIALRYYRQAIQVFEAKGDNHWQLRAYANMGSTYANMDDIPQARYYYRKAQNLLSQRPSKTFQGWLLIHVGETFVVENLAQAEQLILEGIALIRSVGGLEGIERAHEVLYENYQRVGRFAEALEQYKAFSSLMIKKLQDVNEKRTQALSVQFEVERLKQEQELYKLKNIELARMIKQLEELSTHDALTNLYNRRFLDEHLRSSFREALELQQPLSIILSDIDDFKHVNDNFSHAIGDEVLRIVAKIFQDCCQFSDVSARYGGEEFIIVCKNRTLEQAHHLAELIRSSIEQHPWQQLHEDLQVTISMGICADTKLKDHEKMVAAADKHLYIVKNSGKNNISY